MAEFRSVPNYRGGVKVGIIVITIQYHSSDDISLNTVDGGSRHHLPLTNKREKQN